MRVQGFVECEAAEIRGFIDGIGLTDRIEDDATFLGDVVDRELHGRRKAADDEIHLFLLDQLKRARRSFPGIELVVAHDQFRLASIKAAGFVELGHSKLSGAHLVLGFGAVETGQRDGKADLDIGLLRPKQVDPKRRGGKCGACARRDQQATAGNRSGPCDLPGHGFVLRLKFFWPFADGVFAQIRPRAVRITCGVKGISVILVLNGLSASLTALATAAAAPAVPASPAPLAPNSLSSVGDTTWPTSISGISPDIGTR